VFLLQLGAVGYSGGCAVAWAIDLLLGIGGNVCGLGLRMELGGLGEDGFLVGGFWVK